MRWDFVHTFYAMHLQQFLKKKIRQDKSFYTRDERDRDAPQYTIILLLHKNININYYLCILYITDKLLQRRTKKKKKRFYKIQNHRHIASAVPSTTAFLFFFSFSSSSFLFYADVVAAFNFFTVGK